LGVAIISLRRCNLFAELVLGQACVSVSIEKGSPGSSMGAIAMVLQSLNLAEDISWVAKDDLLGRKLRTI